MVSGNGRGGSGERPRKAADVALSHQARPLHRPDSSKIIPLAGRVHGGARDPDVRRYVGLALLVCMTVGLTAALGVILVQSVPERLPIRLTAFDGIAAVGGAAPRLRAALEDADTGKPVGADTWLAMRCEGGWAALGWTSANGFSAAVGPSGLGAGPHGYTAGLPETSPRLDVYARGTIWVKPADTPVVWVDAAAIVPTGQGEPAPSPAVVRDRLGVLKTLAAVRDPVYLVRAEPAGYAAVRRGLAELEVPPGPAFWIRPVEESPRLHGLKSVWPRVRGAVVVAPALAEAVGRLGVSAAVVPPAAGPETPTVVIGAWRDAAGLLSVPLSGGTVGER